MKVKIICEKCQSEVVLEPETVGHISYAHQPLLDNDFSLFESDIETDFSMSMYDDFGEKLANAKTPKEVEQILDEEIDSNVDINTELKSIRFNCTNCGDYIVLDF